MELYSSSENCCVVYEKRTRTVLFKNVCHPLLHQFPVPWLFFSNLLLLQSTLHLQKIKNYKTYYKNKREEYKKLQEV